MRCYGHFSDKAYAVKTENASMEGFSIHDEEAWPDDTPFHERGALGKDSALALFTTDLTQKAQLAR